MIPPSGNLDEVKGLLEESASLGYNLIGVSLPLNATERDFKELRNFCRSINVDLVTRIDLSPDNVNQLLNGLKVVRRRFEVVCVICHSKQIARQAAKDRRVDILSFPTDPKRRFFDRAEAELASRSFATLEIDMSKLLELRGIARVRLLSCLRDEVFVARKLGVPVILSSGTWKKILLRKPREIISLAYLFDMQLEDAKRGVSDVPITIVNRNRRKLSQNYIAPGIYIVRSGKDCQDTKDEDI